jgi:hypothetical protein
VSLMETVFGRKQEEEEGQVVLEIPVLCRLWPEDGIWNGEAVHLAVAVFGDTFEDTQRNLGDAVISHLQALQEIDKLDETVHMLRVCAKHHRMVLDEMPTSEAMLKFTAGLQDHRVVAIA